MTFHWAPLARSRARSPCPRPSRDSPPATGDLLHEGPARGVEEVRARHCRAPPNRGDDSENFHFAARAPSARGQRALRARPRGAGHLDN
eukprot:2540771-Pyramimonas_sp.AAC.1